MERGHDSSNVDLMRLVFDAGCYMVSLVRDDPSGEGELLCLNDPRTKKCVVADASLGCDFGFRARVTNRVNETNCKDVNGRT